MTQPTFMGTDIDRNHIAYLVEGARHAALVTWPQGL